jgi:hypothetical protein
MNKSDPGAKLILSDIGNLIQEPVVGQFGVQTLVCGFTSSQG